MVNLKLYGKTKQDIIIEALSEQIKQLEKLNEHYRKQIDESYEMIKSFNEIGCNYSDFKKFLIYKDLYIQNINEFLEDNGYDFDLSELNDITNKYNINLSDMDKLKQLFNAVKMNNDDFTLNYVGTLQEEINELNERISELEEQLDE